MNEQARHGFNGSFHYISLGRVCNGIGSLHTQHCLDRRTSVTIHVRSNKLCFITFPNTFRAWHSHSHTHRHTQSIQHCCLRYTERLCWTHEDRGFFLFFFSFVFFPPQCPLLNRTESSHDKVTHYSTDNRNWESWVSVQGLTPTMNDS